MSKENPIKIADIVVPSFIRRKAKTPRSLDVISEGDREAIKNGTFTFIPSSDRSVALPIETESAIRPPLHRFVKEMSLRERGEVARRVSSARFSRIEPDFKAKDWVFDLPNPQEKKSLKKRLMDSASPLAIAEAMPVTNLGALMRMKYDLSKWPPELNNGMSFLAQGFRNKHELNIGSERLAA